MTQSENIQDLLTRCKRVDVMQFAMRMGIPLVAFKDSGGARIQEGVDALSGYGEVFYQNVLLSGVVPQIAVILGPCADGSAIALAGVLVAKVLGPELLPDQQQAYSMPVGTLIAVAGPFVAASGSAVRRRMSHPDEPVGPARS